MKFYISDTHFDHFNIMYYDNRPFNTVEEMNAKMIENWNKVVNKEDEVFILGDFCWDKEPRWIELLEQLNGQKTLIQGNHDISPQKSRRLFADVKEYKVIEDNGRKVVLSHYPIPCFKNHFYGWYHLYGHVHVSFEWNMMEHDRYLMENLYSKSCEMYNVGCMLPYMNYTPRTLDQIIEGYKAWKEYNAEVKING
ncbi:MAG: metallophosphoesterase [Acholeplasmatales bacterium]|nr:metallophosphoesterase [Acholeplasmatales bacterium]